MENVYDMIRAQTAQAAEELLAQAELKPGDIFVVGCSSSEIVGSVIGKGSSAEAAQAVYDGVAPLLRARGLYLAAQCCEHLNRALILEAEAAEKYGYEPVCVVPWEHGGGSFGTAAYRGMERPVAVEHVRARAGMDIGQTLIGMHLCDVAVPVRVSLKQIGQALLTCARTRPKYVGGPRARYE